MTQSASTTDTQQSSEKESIDTSADNDLQVKSPRTGEFERALRPPTGQELRTTVERLRSNQEAWQARSVAERVEVLLEWRSQIEQHRAPLVEALIADTGRKNESAMEVEAVLGMLTRWAKEAPEIMAPGEDRDASIPGMAISGTLHPYPLVGVISPWNFPLLLGVIDAVPALAAGSAVIAKPSEVTPRFIEPLMETIEKVDGLSGVLSFVEGGAAVGSAIPDLVDLVVFTGSVPTGRRVGEAAMRAFIPAFLELGGKDPALVLEGADLERASSALLWGSTANSGQSCLSIERIYVQESIHDEFLELLVKKAVELGTAHESIDAHGIGPLIDPAQAHVIGAQLEDATERGAKIHCGGKVEGHGGGAWCAPTVLSGVDHSMKIMREETFGPVMPVMAVRDAEHAVELANDTEFGLSAAVFAADEETAREIAPRLKFGAVSINDAGLTSFLHEGEKDSFGSSGLGGSRMGPASLRRFVRRQAHLISRSAQPNPWWWPSPDNAR